MPLMYISSRICSVIVFISWASSSMYISIGGKLWAQCYYIHMIMMSKITYVNITMPWPLFGEPTVTLPASSTHPPLYQYSQYILLYSLRCHERGKIPQLPTPLIIYIPLYVHIVPSHIILSYTATIIQNCILCIIHSK